MGLVLQPHHWLQPFAGKMAIRLFSGLLITHYAKDSPVIVLVSSQKFGEGQTFFSETVVVFSPWVSRGNEAAPLRCSYHVGKIMGVLQLNKSVSQLVS